MQCRFWLLYEIRQNSEKLLYKNLEKDYYSNRAKSDHCNISFTEERRIMFVKEVTVENQVGLHARPATFFIQKANEYKSSIWVEKEERRVNAKSLLGVLSLGIVGGTTIRIIADGADEQAAVEGLVKLVNSGFSE